MKKDEFSLNNFDLLRLFAAVQVMIGHLSIHLKIADPWWLNVTGHFPGVPIFFVISGFLISASLERSASLSQYATKRALRIFPALWVCVLLTAAVALALGFGAEPLRFLAWLLLQLCGLIFTPAFLQGFGFGSYNGSLWTIPIELQFYIVLPLLYLLVRRWPQSGQRLFLAAFALALLAALVTRIHYPQFSFSPDREGRFEKLLRYSFIPHIYLFFFGMVMYRLKVYALPWIRGKFLYWLAAYALAATVVPVESAGYVLKSLLLGVTVIAAAYSGPGLSERLLHGYDISYGVYIYHGLMVNIFLQLGLQGQGRYMLAVMALTVLAGWLSWVLVERRCLRLKFSAARAPLAVAPGGPGSPGA